jgi:prophage regulatory protein
LNGFIGGYKPLSGVTLYALDGDQDMQNRIVRLPVVLDRTGLSRSTLYRKIAEGTFPSQVRISVHGTGWSEAEIDRWIADPPAYRAIAPS